MNNLKRMFDEFGEDLNFFNNEVGNLKEEIKDIKEGFEDIYKILYNFKEKLAFLSKSQENISSTHLSNVPTEIKGSSTHHPSFKPLNIQNMGISTGNQGASTDRQTDRHIDNQTQNYTKSTKTQQDNLNTIDSAAEIIESLDNIKKQIRLKFKRLTNQEMLVFSTIYQFDEEKGFSTYKMLAERLNLTESSIRDYVGRLIKKQAPIEKNKSNNKEIELNVSRNLKKITSLNTILKLREL